MCQISYWIMDLAVLLTGSRQVGKTTLVREVLGKTYKYVLLEDPDQRAMAIADPKRFLEKYPDPVIFDEFHQAPELVSYLQGLIDQERKKKGRFVLTGSQNFLMMEQIAQSLAGRMGILVLYGLHSDELPASTLANNDHALGQLLLRGTYPELWSETEILASDWYASYVQTYLERDVRRLTNVGDLASFERFIRVCATRSAQNVNFAEIASDSGVSPSTAQRWLAVLEATYLIRLVQPYHANISSRIKKSPKLYFMDTGLASYLMGFRDTTALLGSPRYGALFETLVYSNFVKKMSSRGDLPNHYYLQTKSKVGVDLVIEKQSKLDLVEIKGTKTLTPVLAEQLVATAHEFKKKVSQCYLLGPFNEQREFQVDGILIKAMPWHHF